MHQRAYCSTSTTTSPTHLQTRRNATRRYITTMAPASSILQLDLGRLGGAAPA
jgi:hypothetical protein